LTRSHRPDNAWTQAQTGPTVATLDARSRTLVSFGDAPRLGGAIAKPPKRHRDGSYSFYFSDPDGNIIQALYEPNISGK